MPEIDWNDPHWIEFVANQKQATLFHHPAWAELLAECYGYQPLLLVVWNKAGRIEAGLPLLEVRSSLTGRRWISLPFTDYCQPLAENEEALRSLTEMLLNRWKQTQVPHEVRWALPASELIHPTPSYMLHSLHLQPAPEEVFKTFSKKFRQYPRKAEREGLHVVSAGDQRDIKTFYSIHLQTRVKLGVPIQPRRWFDLLWKRIIHPGRGHVIIVADGENNPVSGGIVLKHKDKAMIKYSASDPARLDTRCHYYTFWKCIEWACLEGCSVIDFGKTDISDEGLRKFKNGWGAEEKPLTYSVIRETPPSPPSDRLKRITQTIIRRSPPFVCRVMGELFYRHFA